MRLTVNGEAREVPAGITVTALLSLLKVEGEGQKVAVAVEVNEAVVRRARHAEVQLRDGDRVEVVTFVGGG